MATQVLLRPETRPSRAGHDGAAGEALSRSAYGYHHPRRPNLPAMAAAIVACGAIFGSLVFLGTVHEHHRGHHFHRLTVMNLRELHMLPPRPHARPVHHVALSTTPAMQQPIVPPVTIPPPVVALNLPSPILVAPGPPAPPIVEQGHPTRAAGEGHDLSSTVIDATPPTYPIEARRSHEQGIVVLFVRLAEDGRVAEVSVKQGSGSFRLDRAALNAVRRWRWSPTTVGGESVAVQGYVTIPFVLQG